MEKSSSSNPKDRKTSSEEGNFLLLTLKVVFGHQAINSPASAVAQVAGHKIGTEQPVVNSRKPHFGARFVDPGLIIALRAS